MEMDSQEKQAPQNIDVAKEIGTYAAPKYLVLPAVQLDDWQYVMRRSMQEIIPGLYLG